MSENTVELASASFIEKLRHESERGDAVVAGPTGVDRVFRQATRYFTQGRVSRYREQTIGNQNLQHGQPLWSTVSAATVARTRTQAVKVIVTKLRFLI